MSTPIFTFAIEWRHEAHQLDLFAEGDLISTIPFTDKQMAADFGTRWQEKAERTAAIGRHPAGKARLSEPAVDVAP